MIFLAAGQTYKPRSMYPCQILSLPADKPIHLNEDDTAYGYLLQGNIRFENFTVRAHQYFSFSSLTGAAVLTTEDVRGLLVIRKGFKGQNMVGGPLEQSGRLVYIDGCSDSVLVYPPRLGDPSLNHLHFPQNIVQSFHIHPSIRAGIVVSGKGQAHFSDHAALDLTLGTVFILDERERHRFMTTDSEMHIVAFHPDGDFGPTDHHHPMKNRTLVTTQQ